MIIRKIFYLAVALLIALPVISTAQTGSRAGMREDLQTKRQEMKEMMQAHREEQREKLDQKRANAKEKIAEHRAELKEKLKAIRDERKQRAVERIQDRLTALNERMTNHFTAVVDKIENGLEKVVSRTDKAEEAGRNVASVRSAIVKAEAAIAAARTAITNQAGKVYEVQVRQEDTLKADVAASAKALHADLTTVKRAVQAAHQAVREAATTLARVPRLDAVDAELENSDANQ